MNAFWYQLDDSKAASLQQTCCNLRVFGCIGLCLCNSRVIKRTDVDVEKLTCDFFFRMENIQTLAVLAKQATQTGKSVICVSLLSHRVNITMKLLLIHSRHLWLVKWRSSDHEKGANCWTFLFPSNWNHSFMTQLTWRLSNFSQSRSKCTRFKEI